MILSALYDLPAVDEAGGEEVNSGLHLQGAVFKSFFGECVCQSMNADIGVDLECGRGEI